jgi:hypothetical protein
VDDGALLPLVEEGLLEARLETTPAGPLARQGRTDVGDCNLLAPDRI